MSTTSAASTPPTSPKLIPTSLKRDHELRPLWVDPDTLICYLETFVSLSDKAKQFLNVIGEPVSRPSHIHEYQLTTYSLYAALSVGLDRDGIIRMLDTFSKTELPSKLTEFIWVSTEKYSKVKLVLKKNKYFIESDQREVLDGLLQDGILDDAKVNGEVIKESAPDNKDLTIPGMKYPTNEEMILPPIHPALEEGLNVLDSVYTIEIRTQHVEQVKKKCDTLGYPLLEEYSFRDDTELKSLDMELKSRTKLRPYQEISLNKMFSNGRSRSGIIVLPCGAGKTLVGITACCTINKPCLILCTSAISVSQWRLELLKFTTIHPDSIATFTSMTKEFYTDNIGIVITTYSMVGNLKHRSHTSKKMMSYLQAKEWGFLLLDEVHVVPANMFRQVVSKVHSHTKLGLTATLVREDDKITDLNFLIGPKLYEANWLDLSAEGHIASVECAEVWCNMTPQFYREYLRSKTSKRPLLFCMNPTKFQATQYLIQLHESRGDKVIVFSDNVYALKAYALKLQRPYIYGGTAIQERLRILQQFRYNPLLNTIFLSKVGDTSIDLPEANVLIQISSHFGSRRQEAQRLGRILRSKPNANSSVSKFNAFFYSLVSKDTVEMYFSAKRQQFLIDQGYAFKIITQLDGMDKIDELVYPTVESQMELLNSVLMASELDAMFDQDMDGLIDSNSDQDDDEDDEEDEVIVKRTEGSMLALTGADQMAYIEHNRPVHHQFRRNNLKRNPNNNAKTRK